MRKSIKIALIVAAVCIGIGTALSAAAITAAGFDLVRLGTVTMISETVEVEGDFSNIVVNVPDHDVLFYRSSDGTCRVEYETYESMSVRAKADTGTLYIDKLDSDKYFFPVVSFAKSYVKVYLPSENYSDLFVNTDSANVHVNPGFLFHNAVLDTMSGDIYFASEVVNTLNAKTLSGDIALKNGEVALAVKAETTSGDIDISCMTPYDVSAKTTSGDVTLNIVKADGEIAIETVSGDIELLSCDAKTLVLHTVSGDVYGTLMSGKDYDVKSTSGWVRIPASHKMAGACEITTTSGNIRIEEYE